MKNPRDILDFLWKNAEYKGKVPNGLDSTPKEFIDTALAQLEEYYKSKLFNEKSMQNFIEDVLGFGVLSTKNIVRLSEKLVEKFRVATPLEPIDGDKK